MAFLRRRPIGPLDYGRRLWIRTSLLATFVFLYAPIVTLMIFSFNDESKSARQLPKPDSALIGSLAELLHILCSSEAFS